MAARQRSAFTLACLLILLIGFALRLTRLDVSLNYDELVTAKSILVDRLDPTKVEARMFVYLLLTAPLGWLVPNEWGMRWTSVMAGMLSIALGYRIAARLADRRAGLMAATLIALAPYYVHYSQIARYYSLVACFALLSIFLLVETGLKSRRWAYPLTLTLLSGLHMLTVIWVAVQLGIVAARRLVTGRGERWSILIASASGIAAILVVIQLIGMVGRFNFAQGLSWIEVRSPITEFIFFMGSALGLMLDFGQIELPFRVINLIIGAVGLFSGVGLWRRWSQRADHTDWSIPLLIALAALPSLILIGVTHTIVPLFVVRYVMPSATAVIILAAVGMSAVRPAWIANGTIAIIAVISLISHHAFITKPEYRREEWREAVQAIQEQRMPSDSLLACTRMGARALDVYAPELSYHDWTTSGVIEADRVWVIGQPPDCKLADLEARLETQELDLVLNFPNVDVYLFERMNHE